jgi:hypothetical protein
MPDPVRATGSSLESFEEAVENALAQIPANANREGIAEAEVARSWVSTGGFVGRTQYHVELVASREAGDRGRPG